MGGFCAKKQQLRYCETNIGLYSQFWRIGVGLKGLYGCWYLIIIAINTKRSFSILLTIISIHIIAARGSFSENMNYLTTRANAISCLGQTTLQ